MEILMSYGRAPPPLIARANRLGVLPLGAVRSYWDI